MCKGVRGAGNDWPEHWTSCVLRITDPPPDPDLSLGCHIARSVAVRGSSQAAMEAFLKSSWPAPGEQSTAPPIATRSGGWVATESWWCTESGCDVWEESCEEEVWWERQTFNVVGHDVADGVTGPGQAEGEVAADIAAMDDCEKIDQGDAIAADFAVDEGDDIAGSAEEVADDIAAMDDGEMIDPGKSIVADFAMDEGADVASAVADVASAAEEKNDWQAPTPQQPEAHRKVESQFGRALNLGRGGTRGPRSRRN